VAPLDATARQVVDELVKQSFRLERLLDLLDIDRLRLGRLRQLAPRTSRARPACGRGGRSADGTVEVHGDESAVDAAKLERVLRTSWRTVKHTPEG
jgi:hypothetical protein